MGRAVEHPTHCHGPAVRRSGLTTSGGPVSLSKAAISASGQRIKLDNILLHIAPLQVNMDLKGSSSNKITLQTRTFGGLILIFVVALSGWHPTSPFQHFRPTMPPKADSYSNNDTLPAKPTDHPKPIPSSYPLPIILSFRRTSESERVHTPEISRDTSRVSKSGFPYGSNQ